MELDLVLYRLRQASSFLLPVDWLRDRRREWLFDFELGRAPFVFVSQGKSGRTWIRVMLSKLWQDRYQAPVDQLIHFDNYHRHDARIPIMLFTHDEFPDLGDPTSTVERALRRYHEKQLIFMFRDPRDVVVSSHYQLTRRNRNPIRQNMIDYVTDARTGLPMKVAYLNAWAKVLPNIPSRLVLQYETLRADPAAGLRRIGEFLDMNLSETEIATATAYSEFDNMRELERQQVFSHPEMRPWDPSDPNSFKVRRGKIGGYRDELDADTVAWMDDYVRENLSDFYPYAAAAKTV